MAQAAPSAAQASGKPSGSNTAMRIWQQLYSGIIFGLMLGLMSVGMNLVYGTIGLSMALQYTFRFFFGDNIVGIVKSVPASFQLSPVTTNAPTIVSALGA